MEQNDEKTTLMLCVFVSDLLAALKSKRGYDRAPCQSIHIGITSVTTSSPTHLRKLCILTSLTPNWPQKGISLSPYSATSLISAW